MIYVVINEALKEFWIADHYDNRIEKDVEFLKELYGKSNINYYYTDIKYLSEEIADMEYKGYKKRHYADWIIKEQ